MQRHELDVVSLFAGLMFVAIAAGYAVTHTTGVRVHWLIAIPALLLLVGAAVTTMAVRRIVAGREPAYTDGDVTENT
jgi:general stress protein CsbA